MINGAPRNRDYTGPVSNHFDGTRFRNMDGSSGGKSYRDLLRWQLGGTRARWPKWIEIEQSRPPQRVVDGLLATFVGHATVLLQASGLNVLTDPVWSDRASPVQFAGPKRVHAPGIAFKHLPPIDAIVVSHNHYDHLDTATLARLVEAHDPVIITPLGNDRVIKAAAPKSNVVTIDWHDSIDPVPCLRVHAEPVAHWSARGRGDRNHALWAGFVLALGERKVYFAGDTGFAGGLPFRKTASRHAPFDLALLLIGAYAPRWFMADSHMDPSEAIQAQCLLGSPPSLAIHHGTFQLTDEAVDEPARLLCETLIEEGSKGEFRVCRPGESWRLL
jgi:L-ascorbate metabolism protein UlaG (beta-lactamase superfamily)